ncbi:MAG: entS [Gammaproteobacteria bacterium]|jgi:MFS family permease|nr:entS [Gammaproteobacteria bacterium]
MATGNKFKILMHYLNLLKHNPNYRTLYFAQVISYFGTMISSIALPYQIYLETHSTLFVGLLSLCQLLPLLFTALFGGVLADRQQRSKILIFTNLFLALCSSLLIWNATLLKPHISIIFITSAIMFGLSGLQRPASVSIQQQLVDKKDFGAVGALAGISYSFGALGGPAIGGLIIAHFGLATAYSCDFVSFLIALTCVLRLPALSHTQKGKDQSTFSAFKEGCQYAFSRQELLGTYFVDFFAMIFGMPMALFPAIAHTHGGPKILGLLYAAPAAGAGIISLSSNWINRVSRHSVAIAVAASLWGIAIILFGLSHQIWLSLFFLVCAGAADNVSGIFRQMIWNQTIPNEFRGRLSGIEMISYLSGPKLGDTESALVAAAFGVPFSIISGGVLCIAAVAACCYYLPKFWNYRAQ